MGSDQPTNDFLWVLNEFLSTLPAWGATFSALLTNGFSTFLSTLPAWGATLYQTGNTFLLGHFYPRSPRGERRYTVVSSGCHFNFYPRSPRGERLNASRMGVPQKRISIHAPRVGSDLTVPQESNQYFISIHAPRVGSDMIAMQLAGVQVDFYPRSPRGERPLQSICSSSLSVRFLSTLPAWGATRAIAIVETATEISIHAPRVGSDGRWVVDNSKNRKFLSTLPAWGATLRSPTPPLNRGLFLSTLPAWGATWAMSTSVWLWANFYPRSPRGERLVLFPWS